MKSLRMPIYILIVIHFLRKISARTISPAALPAIPPAVPGEAMLTFTLAFSVTYPSSNHFTFLLEPAWTAALTVDQANALLHSLKPVSERLSKLLGKEILNARLCPWHIPASTSPPVSSPQEVASALGASREFSRELESAVRLYNRAVSA